MGYPANTTEGETVTIVDKQEGGKLLVADDGRTFAPTAVGGLIEEITAIVGEGAETISEKVDDAQATANAFVDENQAKLPDAAQPYVDLVQAEANELVDSVQEKVEDLIPGGDDEEPPTAA